MEIDRATWEYHGLGLGSGLNILYVRALQISVGGTSAFETDSIWRPMAGFDDLWWCGKRARKRFIVGPGVFQVGEGPIRLLPRESTLVLDVAAPESPSKRGNLTYGEIIAGGQVVARFRNGHWYYADLKQQGPTGMLCLAPASYLGPVSPGAPGVRERLSALAS
jgi:hypothetical protein